MNDSTPPRRRKSSSIRPPAKHFAEAREKAGLPKNLVLYCGRHDFGTVITARTGNLKAVMKVMGHRDVKTAMRYQHPELDIVRVALNGNQGRASEGLTAVLILLFLFAIVRACWSKFSQTPERVTRLCSKEIR